MGVEEDDIPKIQLAGVEIKVSILGIELILFDLEVALERPAFGLTGCWMSGYSTSQRGDAEDSRLEPHLAMCIVDWTKRNTIVTRLYCCHHK